MWTGAFAPVSTDTTVENLERLVSDMSKDKLPSWFMQVMQSVDLLAIVKTRGNGSRKADHILVAMHNTISKVADKAMVKEFEDIYKSELMPQQVGVVRSGTSGYGHANDSARAWHVCVDQHRPQECIQRYEKDNSV